MLYSTDCVGLWLYSIMSTIECYAATALFVVFKETNKYQNIMRPSHLINHLEASI